MTPQERHDQKQLIEQTVTETLLKMGLNIQDGNEFMELQNDFRYLREVRKSVNSFKGKTMIVLMTTIFTGFLGAAFLGLKQMLGFHG